MSHSSYPTSQPGAFKGSIGVAQSDITPPTGIYSRNWGAAKHDVAEGTHQPMTLTCITFRGAKNEKPLVLIGADLGGWKIAQDEWKFRSTVLDALNIDQQNFMFCLSHTHSGPSLSTGDISKPGGKYIPAYLESLADITIRTVKEALSKSVPAVLTWSYGKCTLATNRDLYEKESDRFVVGFSPDEEADDTLLVGRVTDQRERIIGTIVNYACHPTTLAWDNRLISPDYVGSMRNLVQLATNSPCLFLQGASGELSPAEQYSGNTELAEKHGRRLGYAVLSTLESMHSPAKELSFEKVVESGAPLAVWAPAPFEPSEKISAISIDVPFVLKDLPSLAKIQRKYDECNDRVMKERLYRKRNVRIWIGDGDVSKSPLWVWQLGNSFIIGQPNEAYSIFQKEVRQQLSPSCVAVMNLVNGGVGYLPPSDAYGKDIYQEWQSPFAAGSLEMLIKSAVDAMRNII